MKNNMPKTKKRMSNLYRKCYKICLVSNVGDWVMGGSVLAVGLDLLTPVFILF